MSTQEKQGGNLFAIATMFALFFMIAFVTNFASPMGVIAKNQFNASNALSQLGNAANFKGGNDEKHVNVVLLGGLVRSNGVLQQLVAPNIVLGADLKIRGTNNRFH